LSIKILSTNLPDTSLELVIQRHHEGVKLIRPDANPQEHQFYPLDSIFKLPFNVYFDRHDHIAVNMNEYSAKACGYESTRDIIGRTWFEFFTKETVVRGICNEIEVMESEKLKILQDTLVRHDDVPYSYINISYPWYSEDDKIIGVFGCSFPQSAVAESLTQLYEFGLLSKPNKKCDISPTLCEKFTKREIQCIEYIMQGKSTKAIANALHLSARTIEHYISSIKSKMNVRTKVELMVKISKWSE
jgi:DNA-binding CsgD family transcriptional regulator